MKKYYLLLLTLFGGLTAWTQTYLPIESVGTEGPYSVRKGTAVVAGPVDEQMSAAQMIPFNWSFYGQEVTEYLISDNGYITFNTDQTTSVSDNTVLPNVAAPNLAIFAYWDDLKLDDGAEIRIANHGEAPHRMHVIQWYGAESLTDGTPFYFAIRLYECGDFDIVHNHGSTANGGATVGVQNMTADEAIMQVGPEYGMSITGSGGNNSNDDVFLFADAAIEYDISINDWSGERTVMSGNYTVAGRLVNRGVLDINSLDIYYSVNGATPKIMSVDGLNIEAGIGQYDFSHNIPVDIGVPGSIYEICVWADNLNGNADERVCNDMYCETLVSIAGTSAQDKMVLLEKFTAVWCGNCPNATVTVNQLANDYPTQVLPVMVHVNDVMEFDDGLQSTFGVSGVPAAMVDRKLFSDENFEVFNVSGLVQHVEEQLTAYTPADVSVEATFNENTREVAGIITADFADYTIGDLRFILLVREDNVTGESAYNQSNYYNNTVGHPLEGLGNPIIGYTHNYVLRDIPLGSFGLEGSLPELINQGEIHTHPFSFILPEEFNAEYIRLIGGVANYGTEPGEKEILNVGTTNLSTLVSSNNVEMIDGALSVYPNPATDEIRLSWSGLSNRVNELKLSNIAGKEIYRAVPTQDFLDIDLSNFTKGVYFITIKAGEQLATEKLIIIK